MSNNTRIAIPRHSAKSLSALARHDYRMSLGEFALACMREKILTAKPPYKFDLPTKAAR